MPRRNTMALFSDLISANNAKLYTIERKNGSTIQVVDSIINAEVARVPLRSLNDQERAALNAKHKNLNLPATRLVGYKNNPGFGWDYLIIFFYDNSKRRIINDNRFELVGVRD